MTDGPADRDRRANKAAATGGKAAREAKLAAALRANLVRRKAATRAAQADAAKDEGDQGE